ncbi:MAG: ATP-binding protein [Deltaproteobacteria bacterium]|nr:ATP-binding protein [Deltaproteobacteria bacterium]MDH3801550.1 ATP-binding protein [Deltaproteobacteria bacterium]MDH3897856.1 ATP-binding protein [Deltaproteobacteria bacterium]
MSSFINKLRELIPKSIKDFPDYGEGPRRYSLLRKNLILIICAIALLPLVLMASINYLEYQSALKEEMVKPLRRLITSTKHTLELFLTERESTLRLLIRERSFEELREQKRLVHIFQSLKHEFPEFVDLGLIDSSGLQRSYSGPYGLLGKDYSGQTWFHEVQVRGVHISDVFLGYREFPHFVIAVKKDTVAGDFYVLRATIDTEKFNNLISGISLRPGSDMFIINRQGVLQTPSRYHGNVLEKSPLPVPPVSQEAVISEVVDEQGEKLFGYAYLRGSSSILIVTKKPGEVLGGWFALRGELLLLFIVSTVIIIFVAIKTSRLLVDRIQEADQKRESVYIEMEHTSKLASLGRLAAGVAHEVNNPLAIINEKAGLLKDLVQFSKEYQDRQKMLSLVDSVLGSVSRCRDITHRLLGFAKRMDVKVETIYLNQLIEEVLGFLEKEAFHRNIKVELKLAPELAPIAHDRGQLQQVFLNIINNAFEAVEDGGNIAITTREQEKHAETIEVEIADDGRGISVEDLKHIFDPFYTSGKVQGTGLGLSIAYGIVAKCGGDIKVHSAVGEGSTFTVKLPKNCATA